MWEFLMVVSAVVLAPVVLWFSAEIALVVGALLCFLAWAVLAAVVIPVGLLVEALRSPRP